MLDADTEALVTQHADAIGDAHDLSKARREAVELTLRTVAEAGEWPPKPAAPAATDSDLVARLMLAAGLYYSAKFGVKLTPMQSIELAGVIKREFDA